MIVSVSLELVETLAHLSIKKRKKKKRNINNDLAVLSSYDRREE